MGDELNTSDTLSLRYIIIEYNEVDILIIISWNAKSNLQETDLDKVF